MLPSKYRVVLVLRDIEQLSSTEEAAAALNLQIPTLKRELLVLVHDLHVAHKDNQTFLHARFVSEGPPFGMMRRADHHIGILWRIAAMSTGLPPLAGGPPGFLASCAVNQTRGAPLRL
jgi:hypothetical protein